MTPNDKSTPSAGFRIVLAVAIVGHAIAALFYAVLIADESVRSVFYFGSKIVVNAIPLVWVFAVEWRPFRWPVSSKRGWASGIAAGLFIAGFLLALYFFAFAGRLDTSGLRAKAGAYGALDHFFLFAVFLCVGNSAMEEYYWRWFVFGSLRRVMRFAPAVVVSSLGFTLHHIVVLAASFTDIRLVLLYNVGVFAGGCIWAILYEKCGTIYAPWVSHLLVDVAIMVAAYDLLIVQAV